MFVSRASLTAPIFNRRSAAFGISGSLTKTFTIVAQASDASRWVRASPQKKLKK
ncbi:MAG: hypothetical protein MPL62_07100 [Alphaproteobacteria bacterium]|nr:hypothetical protein [Alphaproteobacteria bacterium]